MAAVIKAKITVRSTLSPHVTVQHKQFQANMAHHRILVHEVSHYLRSKSTVPVIPPQSRQRKGQKLHRKRTPSFQGDGPEVMNLATPSCRGTWKMQSSAGKFGTQLKLMGSISKGRKR